MISDDTELRREFRGRRSLVRNVGSPKKSRRDVAARADKEISIHLGTLVGSEKGDN